MTASWSVGLWPELAPLSSEQRQQIDSIKPDLVCDRAALTALLEAAVAEHRLSRLIRKGSELVVNDDHGHQIGRLHLQHKPRKNQSAAATFRPMIDAWIEAGFSPSDVARVIELVGGPSFETVRAWCYNTTDRRST